MTGFDSDALALLIEIRDELRGLRRALCAPVEPDPAVALLLHVIAEETGGKPFSVAELLETAEVAPTLRAAMEASGARNGRRIGKLLSRCAGQTFDGFIVERRGSDREGCRWVCEFQTRKTRGASIAPGSGCASILDNKGICDGDIGSHTRP